jgi:hypothetical protein
MKPVRIKYYGLFWISKRGYLLTTLALFVLGMVLFVVAWVLFARSRSTVVWPPPFHWPWEAVPPGPPASFAVWIYHHFWTIIILLLFAEAIDILVMLRKFARLEAEQEVQAALTHDEDDR